MPFRARSERLRSPGDLRREPEERGPHPPEEPEENLQRGHPISLSQMGEHSAHSSTIGSDDCTRSGGLGRNERDDWHQPYVQSGPGCVHRREE